MFLGFLGALADDRKIEAAADHFGDLFERHAVFGDRVIGPLRRAIFEREPIKAGGVEAVRRRPAI